MRAVTQGRRILTAAGTAVVVAVLSSCGSDGGSASADTTVTTIRPTVAPVVVTTTTTTTPGPTTYVVQSGDTLGVIAQQHGVALADLVAVNGIDDPNRISVGQELVIPDGTTPVATTVPEATTTTAG